MASFRGAEFRGAGLGVLLVEKKQWPYTKKKKSTRDRLSVVSLLGPNQKGPCLARPPLAPEVRLQAVAHRADAHRASREKKKRRTEVRTCGVSQKKTHSYWMASKSASRLGNHG